METVSMLYKTVEIICKNTNTIKEYRLGTSLFEICKDHNISSFDKIIAAKVNNKLRELDYEVFKPKIVEFITLEDSTGHGMYMRSTLFILFKAVRDLYPQASLHIEHSLPLGFYCEIQDLGEELSNEHIHAIQSRAKEIIALDLPFERKQILTADAIEIYKKNRLFEKVALFETRNELYTSVYSLGGVANYFYGYLVPSTAYIKEFYIEKYFNGLLALLPKKIKEIKQTTNSKSFIKESENGGSKLFKIFQEHKEWLNILGVPYVGTLNQVVLHKEVGQIIKISEALHEKKIAKIADEINLQDNCKLVLISGPSSSGKTTFGKRLGVQLQVLGYKTVEISLDDYFIDREFTPRDANGEYDFENIDAIDISFFNKQLLALLNMEEIDYPSFDFLSGKRNFIGKKLKMEEKSILIVEGIHALNPKLTHDIQNKFKYKIFVSALTHMAIDTQNPIQSTDNRLIRRIIRDNNYRGYSARETIKRWKSVRNGENKNIFPFQENADIMFNSALLFELGVLKNHAEPLLRAVPENCEEYMEAGRLLKFLSYFLPIEETGIPPTSILREFLGGSSFVY